MAAFNNAIGMHLRLALGAVARNSARKGNFLRLRLCQLRSPLIFNISEYNGNSSSIADFNVITLYDLREERERERGGKFPM